MGQMFTDPFELVDAGDFSELSAKRCSHVFEPQLHSLIRNIEGISYNSPCHFPFLCFCYYWRLPTRTSAPLQALRALGSQSHTPLLHVNPR